MKCSFTKLLACVIACGVLVVTSQLTWGGSSRLAMHHRSREAARQPVDDGRIVARISPHLSQAVVNAGSWAPLLHDWPQDTCPHERRYAKGKSTKLGWITLPESASVDNAGPSNSGTRGTCPARPAKFSPLRPTLKTQCPSTVPPVWFWDGPLAAGVDGPFCADLQASYQSRPWHGSWLVDFIRLQPIPRNPFSYPGPQNRSWNESDFREYRDPFGPSEMPWHSLGEQYLAMNQADEAKSNKVVRDRNIVRELFEVAKYEWNVLRSTESRSYLVWPRVERLMARISETTRSAAISARQRRATIQATTAASRPFVNVGASYTRELVRGFNRISFTRRAADFNRHLEMHLCGTQFLNDWYVLKAGWWRAVEDAQVVKEKRLVVPAWAMGWTADWLELAGNRLHTASQALRRSVELEQRHQAHRATFKAAR